MGEKREFTTKRVIVSAKYLLSCMAADRHVTYPVTLAINGRNERACYSLRNADEIRNILNSPHVLECSVSGISKTMRGSYVDIEKRASLEIPYSALAHIRHNSVLYENQVIELYKILFCEKNK